MLERAFILLLLLSATVGSSQSLSDTTYTTKEVLVLSPRLDNFSSGTKIQKLDSTTMSRFANRNLGDLLMEESPLFIKSYGLGSLATSAFRGGSANHTAILWNGFNINSPMNGQIDLSLIPANLSNNVSIQYGGTSALWGSGALGGAIHLNNRVLFDKGYTIKAGLSAGSFNDFRQNILVEISKKRFVSTLKVFNAQAKNNFKYDVIRNNEITTRTQQNAELKQTGLISENTFRINSRQRINLNFWYQTTDRNLPPTMVQIASSANQKDQSSRITSEWKRTGNKAQISARAGYFNEYLNYLGSNINADAISRSHTLITEAEAKVYLSSQVSINVGINNNWEKATSDGYPNSPTRNRLSAFASVQHNSKKNKSFTTISARQEMVANELVPFTCSLGNSYRALPWLTTKANVSKVYRIPTFNDLYWTPGGNKDLLSESGYSAEAGLVANWKVKEDRITFTFEPTVFTRTIDNWILWLPQQNYWVPQNIMKVWSRGMETRSELAFKFNELGIKFGLMTHYVVSTNELSKTANDASIDKQLIYTPMYSGHAKAGIVYKGFSLTYIHSYTGYRYTSTDNSSYLEPFTLANIYASYSFNFNKCTMNVFVQSNNLFNTDYEIMMSRPMPQRNYMAGLSFQFNQPNKTNP